MKQKHFLFSVPLCISILLSSCSKNDAGPEVLTDPERTEIGNLSVEAFLTANKVFAEGMNVAGFGQRGFHMIGENPELSGQLPADFFSEIFPSTETGANCYAVFTSQQDESAYTLNLDFGDGCTGVDGLTRAGKIVLTYVFADDNGLISLKLDYNNYRLNEYIINGNVEKSISIHNSDGHSRGSYRITGPKGSVSTVEFDQPFSESNDSIQLSGNLSGVYQTAGRSISWAGEIADPIAIKPYCPFPVAGVITFSQSGHNVATLDYGSGSCDREAELTVNAEQRIISLY